MLSRPPAASSSPRSADERFTIGWGMHLVQLQMSRWLHGVFSRTIASDFVITAARIPEFRRLDLASLWLRLLCCKLLHWAELTDRGCCASRGLSRFARKACDPGSLKLEAISCNCCDPANSLNYPWALRQCSIQQLSAARQGIAAVRDWGLQFGTAASVVRGSAPDFLPAGGSCCQWRVSWVAGKSRRDILRRDVWLGGQCTRTASDGRRAAMAEERNNQRVSWTMSQLTGEHARGSMTQQSHGFKNELCIH